MTPAVPKTPIVNNFVLKVVVRPHEAHFGDRAQPQAILNYLQDAAFLHSIRDLFSVHDLLARGLTWVMSRYRVEILREPALGEEVTVRTWFTGRHKQAYLRDFLATGADGAPVVRATSSWLVLDTATRLPFAGEDVLGGLAPREERALTGGFGVLPAAAAAPGGIAGETAVAVRESDLDLNRHVNHVHYIQWALDSLPEAVRAGRRPRSLDIAYRAEALLGDRVLARWAPAGPPPGEPSGGGMEGHALLHQLVRESDGRELTRLRTAWAP